MTTNPCVTNITLERAKFFYRNYEFVKTKKYLMKKFVVSVSISLLFLLFGVILTLLKNMICLIMFLIALLFAVLSMAEFVKFKTIKYHNRAIKSTKHRPDTTVYVNPEKLVEFSLLTVAKH